MIKQPELLFYIIKELMKEDLLMKAQSFQLPQLKLSIPLLWKESQKLLQQMFRNSKRMTSKLEK